MFCICFAWCVLYIISFSVLTESYKLQKCLQNGKRLLIVLADSSYFWKCRNKIASSHVFIRKTIKQTQDDLCGVEGGQEHRKHTAFRSSQNQVARSRCPLVPPQPLHHPSNSQRLAYFIFRKTEASMYPNHMNMIIIKTPTKQLLCK